MFKKQKQQTRLGDILISKGLITQEQLDKAIQEQSRRKHLLDPADTNAKVTPLGEILIEMQFIDRMQLKRGLNWQQRLRHASIAMALCAPFMMFMPNIARAAPITIQAENYTSMSGVRNENTLDVGGGKNVGYIDAGDWIRYKGIINIPVTGTYKITFRVASSSGGSFQLKDLSGKLIDTITVPATGGLQTWVDVERTIPLTAGSNDWNIRSITGGFNINWMKVELAGEEATVPPVTAPALTIQAENYSTMSGVQVEGTVDVGGGKNVGYIEAGDWMEYKGISVPVTGTYKVTFRVASLTGGGSFQLKSGDKVIDTVAVPATGGWQTWVDIERTVSLTAGSNDLTLLAQATGFNINWMKLDLISEAAPVPAPSITIQSEDYSSMSGVQTEGTVDVGGGKNVGYIEAGDWMEYKGISVPVTGTYKVTFRVASLTGGGSFQLKSGDKVIDNVAVPATGGWQTWVDIERTVSLTAGSNDLTLLAQATGFNINWMKLDLISEAAPVPAPSITIQSEDYSSMSGVQTEGTVDVGGGKSVGYIDAGDWMEYKNVEVFIPKTASYKVTYRVAGQNAGGSFTLYEAGGSAVFDTVPVPVTGGWQKWTSVERIVTLPAGKHYFGVKALAGGFNVNWIKVEPVDQTSNPISPPPVTSSVASSSSSSVPSTITSSSSSSKPSTAVSSSWSSSSAANNAQHVAGPVGITWTPPNARENGEYLDVTELGGYEIRYKKASDSTFTYISINDAWTTSYQFEWLEGDYVFQIAAFDKNGVYSPFVDIQRQ